MALRSNKTTIPADDVQETAVPVETPATDTPIDPAVAIAEAKEKAAARKAKEAADLAAKEAAVATVPKHNSSLATVSVAAPSIASLYNAMDPRDIGTAFKRIVASGGACEEAGTHLDLGKYLDIQILSVSERWMVVPEAEEGDTAARKFCRCSYDEKTIFSEDGDGMTIDEYIESVSDVYPEFKPVKKYNDVFALILHTGDKSAEETAKGYGIVQVSVSPTAIKSLKTYSMQTKLFIARGQLPADKQNCVRVIAKKDHNAETGKSWTVFEFALIPSDDMDTCEPIAM